MSLVLVVTHVVGAATLLATHADPSSVAVSLAQARGVFGAVCAASTTLRSRAAVAVSIRPTRPCRVAAWRPLWPWLRRAESIRIAAARPPADVPRPAAFVLRI